MDINNKEILGQNTEKNKTKNMAKGHNMEDLVQAVLGHMEDLDFNLLDGQHLDLMEDPDLDFMEDPDLGQADLDLMINKEIKIIIKEINNKEVFRRNNREVIHLNNNREVIHHNNNKEVINHNKEDMLNKKDMDINSHNLILHMNIL